MVMLHSIEDGRRARQRLDQRLRPLKPVEQFMVPPKGWIKAIREALGMSGVQFGKRLGVSPQTANALEKSEVNASIKIETLRKAAEALDCTLVYALVPNSSLDQTVKSKAEAIAKAEISRVSHTMKLEDQTVGQNGMAERIEAYTREVLQSRDIWKQL
jgi:predicted DNA-binding mobile mystery protein A